MATYHRVESPTQAPHDAHVQQQTHGLGGRPARWSQTPKVKAYEGRLPEGARGIEFTTDVPPDRGSPPGQAVWSGPRPGVTVEGDYAKIRVHITKNTQT